MARSALRPRGPFNPKVVIEGYFDLRYAENPGVAFSMLQDIPGGLLSLVAVGAFVLVLVLPAQDCRPRAPACTSRSASWAAARSATSSIACSTGA